MNKRELRILEAAAFASLLAAATGCDFTAANASTAFGQLGPFVTESMATQITGLGSVPTDVLGGTIDTTGVGTVVSPVQPAIGTTLAGPSSIGMGGSPSTPGTLTGF
jgi:hypothetical protein